MPPTEHLELAAFVSMHGPRLIARGQGVSAGVLNRYWIAAKGRWERWMAVLKRFSLAASGGAPPANPSWPRVRGVIQQVLLSDVPTRVWTAALAGSDHERGVCEAEPVARSVLMAHADARCRAMRLLLHTPGVSTDDALRLNRLRRQTDRWSDVFVAHIAAQHHDILGDVTRFAASPSRAKEFSADFRHRPEWQAGQSSWRLLRGAWQRGLATTALPGPRIDDRGEAVAAAMLESFEPLELLAAGLSHPLWLMRFQSAASQTHDLVDELCRQEFA